MGKPITDDTIRAILKNLQEFGYSSVTFEFVKESVTEIQRTKQKPSANIIGMFAYDMLIENGYDL